MADRSGSNKSASSGAAVRPSLDSIDRLLPTPTSGDSRSSGSALYPKTETHSPGTTLTDATVRLPEMFGQYSPAIARWEQVMGRTAPEPTLGGKLSPAFVEWMMGLPAGHVTDHTTSRAKALKILGNGVVPQQAAVAIAGLWDRLEAQVAA